MLWLCFVDQEQEKLYGIALGVLAFFEDQPHRKKILDKESSLMRTFSR